jgi:hypothetical protein
VPKYRVELREDHVIGKHDQPINPFHIRDLLNHRARRRARIWEFEAKDEDEVRRYYREAKAADLEGVRGFDLYSVALAATDRTADK